MSIATELTLLANSKQAIKASINAKGGSVTDSTPFADYSTAIDNLPSGGSNADLIDLIERDITTLNIPSGTTKIGEKAFNGCNSLTSITIPDSVTTIGDNAFQGCTSLASINIPSNVTRLGTQCFAYCVGLTSIIIPDSVTTIPAYLVDHCDNLTEIIVGNNVSTIQGGAFSTSNDNFVLRAIVINSTTVPNLQSIDAFNYTRECPIYVPAESLNAYKTGYRWSDLSSRIYPITQVATVDGNPVYNYEIGNKDATTVLDIELAKMPAGTSVEFSEGLTNITAGRINYQQVTLPSTFTGFGDSDMIGSSVTTITSNAVTPPGAFRNQLGGSGLTAIYVPASAVDAYKENATWSSFASIIQAIPAE